MKQRDIDKGSVAEFIRRQEPVRLLALARRFEYGGKVTPRLSKVLNELMYEKLIRFMPGTGYIARDALVYFAEPRLPGDWKCPKCGDRRGIVDGGIVTCWAGHNSQ